MNRLLVLLIGDPRENLLEIRLFNAVSLLNGSTNVVGSLVYLLTEPRSLYLFCLHLVSGVLLLVFYYFARSRGKVSALFWPFVLTLCVFLFLNILADSGTGGAAHYYLIPAVIIATILTQDVRRKILSGALFVAATLIILLIQQYLPGQITTNLHLSRSEAGFMFNMGGNLLFVQVFSGLLVFLLSRTLNQERQKSDRLLLSILPETVAEELKRNDTVTPRKYDSASVLFTDFVGFTREAEHLSPEQLVGELDGLFSGFDEIVRERGLEKIKTIGDAYMACGGLPEPTRTHAIDCVLAALGIQKKVQEMGRSRKGTGRPIWGLRAGIHSGPLVAGVIGRDKFAFDVWGDTVNTASRMETASETGCVNISSATHGLVRDFFLCDHRGLLPAKNKGEVDMYFVVSLRPEFARDQEGLLPNQRFQEAYEKVASGL